MDDSVHLPEHYEIPLYYAVLTGMNAPRCGQIVLSAPTASDLDHLVIVDDSIHLHEQALLNFHQNLVIISAASVGEPTLR